MQFLTSFLAFLLMTISLYAQQNSQEEDNSHSQMIVQSNMTQTEKITLGAGCFWCVEAIFQRIDGVISVVSGYSNGKTGKPTYKEVCSGLTGYAEVCQIEYDPAKVSFIDLLEVFWKTHDPTTLNRQGGDVGTQYRSAIFYHTAEQKKIAEEYKQKLIDEKVFDRLIVTEIAAVENFYGGEEYHQNYFNENSSQAYCRLVIQPKVEKFEKVFNSKIKK